MGFTVNASVPVLMVFVQGVISFLSPCVLPLLPLYIGYLSGTGTVSDGRGRDNRKRLILHTVFFVAGISFAFFLLGMGMSAFALLFRKHQLLLSRAGGVLVILFGLYALGLFGQVGFLAKERRVTYRMQGVMGVLSAFFLGFFFSFSWTPCVGPTLATVLLIAASSASRAYGMLLIGVYTVGFCIPFLLTGLFATSLLALMKKHRGVVQYTTKIGGVLMILMGILMVTGQLNRISAQLATFG